MFTLSGDSVLFFVIEHSLVSFGIAQIVLAVVFGMAGVMKLVRTREQLAVKMGWVNDFTQQQIRYIGGIEVLSAAVLVLSLIEWGSEQLWFYGASRYAGAVGAVLFLTMCGAAFTHARRKEYPMIVLNGVLGVLAAYVFFIGILMG